MAKNSKPFTNFEKFISLQQADSIDMGRVLYSKTVAVDLIKHTSSHMNRPGATRGHSGIVPAKAMTVP